VLSIGPCAHCRSPPQDIHMKRSDYLEGIELVELGRGIPATLQACWVGQRG
jgi:hypothetical protein